MGGFLPVVVGLKGADGERLDKPDVNGDHAPIMLKLGNGITGISGTPGPGGITEIQLGATSSIAFDDHAEFRAADPSSLVDGEVITFKTPPGSYVYFASDGAGFADDDETILKLDAIDVSLPGRAYPANPSAVVATWAALGLAKSGKQSAIQMQAYAVKGDGGGGIFDFDPGDSTSSDNGGTTRLAGSIRWKRRYSGDVDARWFGASPASPNNKPAITAALAVGKGHVFLPRGTWTILTQIVLSAGKKIRGEGEDVTVLHHTGSDGPAVFTGSCEFGSEPHGLSDMTVKSDLKDCVVDEVVTTGGSPTTESNYDAQYERVTTIVVAAGKAGFRATGARAAGGMGFIYFPRYDECRVYGNLADELQAGFRFERSGASGSSGGVVFANVVKPQIWLVNRHFDFSYTSVCHVDSPTSVGAIFKKTFTANAATNVITCTAHGLTDGRAISLTTTVTLPAGLPLDTAQPVFVRDSTTDTFKVALTPGGTAIDITDTGTGVHSVGFGRYYLLGDLCNQTTFTNCKPEIPQAIDLMAEVSALSDQCLIDLATPTQFYQLGDSHTVGTTTLSTRNFTQVGGNDSNLRSEAVTYALLLQDSIKEKTVGHGIDLNSSGLVCKTTGPECSANFKLTGAARYYSVSGIMERPDGSGAAYQFGNGTNTGIGDQKTIPGGGNGSVDLLDHLDDRLSVATNNLTNVVTADCSTITTNGVVILEFHAMCTKDSGAGTGSAGDIAAFSRRVVAKNMGGTVTIAQVDTIGTDVNDIGVSIAVGASAFSVSGTNVRMQITGAVSNTVKMGGSVRRTRTAGA